MAYVVAFTEHLRDGEESGATIVGTLEEALKTINGGNWWPKCNYSFRVYKLVSNIPTLGVDMGMSTYVYGFVPPDAKWKQMKAAYDAYHEAGIDPPDEIGKFFDWRAPDPAGLEIDLGKAVRKYSAEMQDGYEVLIDELPKHVKVIRFVNSY